MLEVECVDANLPVSVNGGERRMYNRCVEGTRQQADLLSWREGGGPEGSDHQLLGQSS